MSDVLLEHETVRVKGELLAVDGRVLIAGDALVVRVEDRDYALSLRMLCVLVEMAGRGALWSWLPWELKQPLLGADYVIPHFELPPDKVDGGKVLPHPKVDQQDELEKPIV